MESLQGKSLLSLDDLSPDDINRVLDVAARVKTWPRGREHPRPLVGRTLALVFEKPSTRTRVSFETAMTHLGGHPMFLSSGELQLARGETVADTARTLSRYVDAIAIRSFSHRTVAELDSWSSVPVINALSDLYHPCQALADFLTMREHCGELAGLTLAYLGDGNNNVTHSLLLGGALLGMDVRLGTPPALAPDPGVLERAREAAAANGGRVRVEPDPVTAVRGARVVYTDVWTSMGKEAEDGERRARLAPYQVHEGLLEQAGAPPIFLHCLPARRGEEVTDCVMDGPCSRVFDQAENRLHVQKALLLLLLEGQVPEASRLAP